MNEIKLFNIANKVRLKTLELAVKKSKGHLGGTFSCIDLLISLYYGGFLNSDPKKKYFKDRNRFILSKGHACLALYIILCDLGFISKKKLMTYGDNGGLGAQLDISLPGIDWNTGSLGHSIGVLAGLGLAAKLDNKKYHSFTIVGDAEMSEGSVWEALAFIGDEKIDNVTVIIDRNRLSVTDILDDIGIYRNFSQILRNLGWNPIEINGHDFKEIFNSLNEAKKSKHPTIILANTIKGKGVSFMENNIRWHHSIPTESELLIAMQELSKKV